MTVRKVQLGKEWSEIASSPKLILVFKLFGFSTFRRSDNRFGIIRQTRKPR